MVRFRIGDGARSNRDCVRMGCRKQEPVEGTHSDRAGWGCADRRWDLFPWNPGVAPCPLGFDLVRNGSFVVQPDQVQISDWCGCGSDSPVGFRGFRDRVSHDVNLAI